MICPQDNFIFSKIEIKKGKSLIIVNYLLLNDWALLDDVFTATIRDSNNSRCSFLARNIIRSMPHLFSLLFIITSIDRTYTRTAVLLLVKCGPGA